MTRSLRFVSLLLFSLLLFSLLLLARRLLGFLTALQFELLLRLLDASTLGLLARERLVGEALLLGFSLLLLAELLLGGQPAVGLAWPVSAPGLGDRGNGRRGRFRLDGGDEQRPLLVELRHGCDARSERIRESGGTLTGAVRQHAADRAGGERRGLAFGGERGVLAVLEPHRGRSQPGEKLDLLARRQRLLEGDELGARP